MSPVAFSLGTRMPLGVGYAVQGEACCLSEPHTRSPQVQGSPMASPVIHDRVLLGHPQPTGQAEPKGWRTCLLPHQCLSYHLGRQGWVGTKTWETCQNCIIFWRQDMAQREAKVLSPLIPFVCLQSSWEELNPQGGVSAQSLRADSHFHPLSGAGSQSRMFFVPSPQTRQPKHKLERWRVSPSQGWNPVPFLPCFPRFWG